MVEHKFNIGDKIRQHAGYIGYRELYSNGDEGDALRTVYVIGESKRNVGKPAYGFEECPCPKCKNEKVAHWLNIDDNFDLVESLEEQKEKHKKEEKKADVQDNLRKKLKNNNNFLDAMKSFKV